MSGATALDPIARLLAGHGSTRLRLEQLSEPALRAEAVAWFDGTAVRQREILRHTLFPALIESMAGSDAVCLKGMTRGLEDQGADLQRRWPSLRAGLDGAAPAPEALRPWIDDYLDYLRRADEELLPMAARLLDETALDELRHALG